jgi:hypothetical protein
LGTLKAPGIGDVGLVFVLELGALSLVADCKGSPLVEPPLLEVFFVFLEVVEGVLPPVIEGAIVGPSLAFFVLDFFFVAGGIISSSSSMVEDFRFDFTGTRLAALSGVLFLALLWMWLEVSLL